MLEALWSVEFVSAEGAFGAGVIVFETNRVFGGHAQYYYLGSYEVRNEVVSGEAEITHYRGEPYSIFRPMEKFKVHLSGRIQEPVMEVSGHLVDDPQRRISMRLTKRADLP